MVSSEEDVDIASEKETGSRGGGEDVEVLFGSDQDGSPIGGTDHGRCFWRSMWGGRWRQFERKERVGKKALRVGTTRKEEEGSWV